MSFYKYKDFEFIQKAVFSSFQIEDAAFFI